MLCGYLGIPLATNVASEEILLDTTALKIPNCQITNIGNFGLPLTKPDYLEDATFPPKT